VPKTEYVVRVYLATGPVNGNATVHDKSEENAEEDGEANHRKREAAGTEKADELIVVFGEEDAKAARNTSGDRMEWRRST
jgi:hypothetical protein